MSAARGDTVRLTRDLDGLPRGMRGVVFGFYRRPHGESYAVLFGSEARELSPADFELLGPSPQYGVRAA